MGRPLSPSQIPQKNISKLSKLHETTSECWQRTSGTQKSRSLSSKTGRKKYKIINNLSCTSAIDFQCSIKTEFVKILPAIQFSSVSFLSDYDPMACSTPISPSFTSSRSLCKLMSIESVMPSNHLILCQPLLLPPSIFPSISVFSNESVLPIRWPKYWSFSFSISPSNEYSGLISFRMDWVDLLAIQGTLKSLLQHYSSKISILWHSAFFIIQLSHT